ncbi:ornithine carbamoyltransferase [bacterium]
MKKFISMQELNKKDLYKILRTAHRLKKKNIKKQSFMPLKGKTAAMIFQKPSTRTRVSFEVGMFQLGGHALYIDSQSSQINRGETIEDTARTLSKYVDCIIMRANNHHDIIALAEQADVPVINGLSDIFHPCQVLSDIYTIMENKKWDISKDNTKKCNKLKVAYIGSTDNVANSLITACAKFGINLTISCPPKYVPLTSVVASAKIDADTTKAKILILSNPVSAVKDADVIYTDVWISMGREKEKKERIKELKSYQVNKNLLSLAKPNAMVMHCLPAHRGEEITDEVIDSKQSVVFEQAGNRLHVQKAILYLLLGNRN